MGGGLVEGGFGGAGADIFGEVEGGGDSRGTPADDGDANHECGLGAPGFRPRDDRFTGEYSCTKRARFFTFSTGVSGRMPWPSLKMWPGRPAASWRICSARDLNSFQSAKSRTGAGV